MGLAKQRIPSGEQARARMIRARSARSSLAALRDESALGSARYRVSAQQGRRARSQPSVVAVNDAGSPARARAELRQAIHAMSSFLMDILTPDGAVLTADARRLLLARMERVYAHRAVGKGFSSLVHALCNTLEDDQARIDAPRLRLLRDSLERLYARPDLSHGDARILRKDLVDGGLPVKNHGLRAAILEALDARRE